MMPPLPIIHNVNVTHSGADKSRRQELFRGRSNQYKSRTGLRKDGKQRQGNAADKVCDDRYCPTAHPIEEQTNNYEYSVQCVRKAQLNKLTNLSNARVQVLRSCRPKYRDRL